MRIFLSAILISCLTSQLADAQYGRYPCAMLQKGKIFDDIVHVNEFPVSAAKNAVHGAVERVSFSDYTMTAAKKMVLADSGYNEYGRGGRLRRQRIYLPKSKDTVQRTYVSDNQRILYREFAQTSKPKEATKTTYHYDNHNHLIKTETACTDPSKAGCIGSTRIYRYNTAGNITGEQRTDESGKLLTRYTYKYDKRGFQVAYTITSTESNSNETFSFAYDDSGFMTEGNYTAKAKWTATNDTEGRPVKKTIYNADGSIFLAVTYKYDDRGNETESVARNEKGIAPDYCEYHDYEYDDAGNITKYTVYGLKNGERVAIRMSEMRYSYYHD
jgi:hypothetical protein